MKIAIASGKGGTGKTMLAVSLASLLSRSDETLLVDLDVEEPNDALFVTGREGRVFEKHRLIPQWDEKKCIICDVCSSSCRYHAVVRLGDIIAVFSQLCHSCHACSELCPNDALPMTKHKIGEIREIYDGKLTLVEGRLKTGEEQGVPLINQVHEMVCIEYGAIPVQIFDCPPGTSCPVVASVKKCDYVVLVTEPTPFGLNDLDLAVKTVRQTGKPMGVVINRDGIGNADIQGFCQRENIEILARIPYDRNIAELYSEGNIVIDQVEYMENTLRSIFDSIKIKT
ncbi:MAG: ATP-binding protein, partial [Bacteroidales bacterium]|nr:ATP-binding protein [Bacteroidales bacterium]